MTRIVSSTAKRPASTALFYDHPLTSLCCSSITMIKAAHLAFAVFAVLLQKWRQTSFVLAFGIRDQ